MKKTINILLLFLITIQFSAQNTVNRQKSAYYQNPIFAGDYPDPSVLRDGKDFYIVHSSFEYYPGLQIWHSTDLIHWEPITCALRKYVGSVWAPDLVKYNGKFYIYFPANDVNYVISADKIEGPWSDPVKLDIPMIDPGHVVDKDGNRYLYFSSGSYVLLSKDGMSVAGKPVHSYDGWKIPEDWSIELFALEGPKLTKHGDYYYLTVAEGGTAGPATGHMVISARSKSPLGPWENSPYNPILRAKTKNEKFASVGHGTIFDDCKGDWYMVFHGYENGYYNMGRQTMLVPIEWTKEGWFKIPDGIKIDGQIKRPAMSDFDVQPFVLSDNFKGKSLRPQWRFFNEYDTTRFYINNSSLTIKAEGTSLKNSAPLLCIPSDHSYTATVELDMSGNVTGGLLLFYNNDFYSGILADSKNILTNMRGWQFVSEKNVLNGHVFLRLKNEENTVDIFYSIDGKEWKKVESSFDVSAYHHNVLSGFKSLRIGLCSIGEGSVTFKNFTYNAL